jgi:hypothetical protein
LIFNPVTVAAPTYSSVGGNSVVQVATGIGTFNLAGEDIVFVTTIPSGADGVIVDLTHFGIRLNQGDTLSVATIINSTSTNLTAGLSWTEGC